MTVIFAVYPARAEDFHPPAGNRYAQISATGTILPGGRLLKPFGVQIETGPGPLGLAVSAKGLAATADTGFDRYGITLLQIPTGKPPEVKHFWARTPNRSVPELADPDWKSVSAGIVFDSEKSLWVSEGRSGRLRQIDLSTGDHKKIVNLNVSGYENSFAVDLAWSSSRRLLIALDRTNARMIVIDAKGWRIDSFIPVGADPVAVALSPDAMTAYVAVKDAVCLVDLTDVRKPSIAARVPESSPEALLATDTGVFVSNSDDDSIDVISAADKKSAGEIVLRIPGLEKFRGIGPAGMALDPLTGYLLVAEAGINAVGVIDTAKKELIGHLPAGWMPFRVAISGDRVFVANAGGRGTGPNQRRPISIFAEPPMLHPGSVSTFIMPGREEILRQTGSVFVLGGFVPYMHDTAKIEAPIEHVVLIVKGSQTFDQVLGDIHEDAAASPVLARFGMHGRATGGPDTFSLQDTPITPNQQAVARRWAFSDNFYTNGDTATEADGWFEHKLPNLASEIAIHGGMEVLTAPGGSDQERADRFILKLETDYVKADKPLPALLIVHLPNDREQPPNPQAGYPYDASYVADNDFATGRILDWLSHTPWWKNTTVFITEHDTEGSLDHLNSRRTLLFAAGPYVKKKYVSHTNSDVPGLYRTIEELLGQSPANLMEATGAGLADMFTSEPDFTPFDAIAPDQRVFSTGH